MNGYRWKEIGEELRTLSLSVIFLFIFPSLSYGAESDSVAGASKALEACLDQKSTLALCKDVRATVKGSELIANKAFYKIERIIGRPGIIAGSTAKIIFDHAIKVPNPLPIGNSNEFVIKPNGILVNIKWDI